MTQDRELLDIYRRFPCRTLPNAFWKTGAQGDALRVTVEWDMEGALTALAVRVDGRFLSFWCTDPMNHPFSAQEVAEARFVLVHDDARSVFSGRDFARQEAYFRLVHSGTTPDDQCPPHHRYADVDPGSEISDVVELIRSCYRNIDIDESIVHSWLAHPTYHPDLWVWIRESETNRPVGLGIAGLDPAVPEASLEWVQVLPKEQRKGLGKALTAELLRRVAGKAAFTTVSGRLHSRSRPERLYRSCGFVGDDIWWLLAENE